MKVIGRVAGLAGCAVLLCAFSSSDITVRSLSVAGGGDEAEVSAVLSRPEGAGRFPAVVLLPTCGGLTPTHREAWPRWLADQGYVSLAVDPLGACDMLNCMSRGIPGRRALFPSWIGDAYGALHYLSRLPYVDKDRVAVMGFSNGGIVLGQYVASDLATPDGVRFRAAVSFYTHCNGDRRPGGDPVEGDPRMPWMVVNGALERAVMNEPCAALKGRPNFSMHVIENAHHGFDIAAFTTPRGDGAGNVMLYSEEATKKAREIVREFLGRHLRQ